MLTLKEIRPDLLDVFSRELDAVSEELVVPPANSLVSLPQSLVPAPLLKNEKNSPQRSSPPPKTYRRLLH
jgi:hypothetical protein